MVEREALAPTRGGVLREGYDYDFSRCDPATGAHVDPAWCAIYETVTIAGPDGELRPLLAERWSVDDDRTTWRFAIRPDVRFHSGAPCDAAAVAAAFRLHSDPVESPVNAFFWRPVRDVRAEGDEVVVRLHHPNAGLPRLLRSWHSAIHDQAARERLGERYGHGNADGTGPFRLAACEPGERFDVVRFDGYRRPVHLDGVRWVPLLDESSRAAALEAGEVDCVQNPSLLDVDRLRENPDLRVVEYQQSALVYLALDHETPPFDDLRVRQAISAAIDRDALVERELAGHGWTAHGPIPSESPWYEPGVERFNRFDPAQARAVVGNTGLRIEALVLEDATVRRVAERLREQLRAVGVELELRHVDGFDAFYGALGSHPPAFVSKWFWPEPVDAIVGFVASWAHAGPNWQRASIAELDAACRSWNEAPDEETRARASSAIQLLSAERLPLVPLLFPATVWAHHRRVHGWRPHPHDLYPLYDTVWIEEDA